MTWPPVTVVTTPHVCEPLRDEWLPIIFKSGQAYSNEIRSMAKELIELRAKVRSLESKPVDLIDFTSLLTP